MFINLESDYVKSKLYLFLICDGVGGWVGIWWRFGDCESDCCCGWIGWNLICFVVGIELFFVW